MNRIALVALSALVPLLAACGFDEHTPTDVVMIMSGSEGAEVQLVVSTNFVASVDELGTTRVTLFRSDTLVRTLPVDTVVSVRINQRFFVEALPLSGDSIPVRVELDVDDRSLYDRRGLVVRESPFRYVYVFRQRLTESVDVVL